MATHGTLEAVLGGCCVGSAQEVVVSAMSLKDEYCGYVSTERGLLIHNTFQDIIMH